MTDNIQYSTGGTGLFGTTFIVFLILKLTHVIDWSWWWVTCPLWIGFIISLVILVIGFFIALLVGLTKGAVGVFK